VWTQPSPGGETLQHAGERADRVLARALAADGDVALFSHGHFLRILAARWLDLPPERGRSFLLGTATLSELGFERETHVLARWNG
jgi:broad specificity phosphatase PhoE